MVLPRRSLGYFVRYTKCQNSRYLKNRLVANILELPQNSLVRTKVLPIRLTHDRKYLPLFEVLDTEVRRREESAARTLRCQGARGGSPCGGGTRERRPPRAAIRWERERAARSERTFYTTLAVYFCRDGFFLALFASTFVQSISCLYI